MSRPSFCTSREPALSVCKSFSTHTTQLPPPPPPLFLESATLHLTSRGGGGEGGQTQIRQNKKPDTVGEREGEIRGNTILGLVAVEGFIALLQTPPWPQKNCSIKLAPFFPLENMFVFVISFVDVVVVFSHPRLREKLSSGPPR